MRIAYVHSVCTYAMYIVYVRSVCTLLMQMAYVHDVRTWRIYIAYVLSICILRIYTLKLAFGARSAPENFRDFTQKLTSPRVKLTFGKVNFR